MGIDGWKADMGADTLPDTVSTSLGVLPRDVFKKYYYADFYDYSTSRNPQAICFARPYSSSQGGAGAPVSRLPAGWGGDYAGDFDGLEQQKVDLYLSAQLGYSAPGIEVGGFLGVSPTKNSLLRYAQLGAMAPIMENGGWNGGETEHLPWYWDQETVDIYRYFATLHSELTPYLFSYSVEANRTGLSILRETDLERSQHKLGEELFVSVLNTDVSAKAVFFPSGGPWIDYWDEAAVYESGVQANYSIPLN
jgi:alpha-D-xyloside xylohydrolase